MKALKKDIVKRFEAKVFRYAPDDTLPWHIKLQKGVRKTFSTGCFERREAAAKAWEIYEFLEKNGMAETLLKYGSKRSAADLPPAQTLTLGQLIQKSEAAWLGSSRTHADYALAVRRIFADIKKISRTGIHGHGENRDTWLAKVDAIRVSDISPAQVEEWRAQHVKQHNGDPAKRKRAETSSNSLLRSGKALFSAERLKKLGLSDVRSPFGEIKLLRRADHRFIPTVKAADLMAKAVTELADDPEVFKTLLLMLTLGLRRAECDRLEWDAINFGAGTVHIGRTAFLHPKSEKSIGTLEIEPEVLEVLRGFRARATGNFVLESEVAPRMDAKYAHYRCEQTFKRLTTWLRGAGITAKSPLHDLRKLFGSMINDKFGLHAASLALRHADVATTASHYVSKREGVTTGLGSMLSAASKVVVIDPGQLAAQA